MAALELSAKALEFESLCCQLTAKVPKLAESGQIVDEKIDSFIEEITALCVTCQNLSKILEEQSLAEAAKVVNESFDGNLWAQIWRIMWDCDDNMILIRSAIRATELSVNPLRPELGNLKQLRGFLDPGNLMRLQSRVRIFNSSLQLPIQMIALTSLLMKDTPTTSDQELVGHRLKLSRESIDHLQSISKTDPVWLDYIEYYSETAKNCLDRISATLTTSSAQIEQDNIDLHRKSTSMPSKRQDLHSITEQTEGLLTKMSTESSIQLQIEYNEESSNDEDNIDLQLLRTYLDTARTEFEQANYSKAVELYRGALSLMQSRDWDSQIENSTTDIALKLGESLVQQERYDEAIDLLRPIANRSLHTSMIPSSTLSSSPQARGNVDEGQSLCANHLMGEIYLRKSDLLKAENHALQAFKRRRRLLGAEHADTVKSLNLVIETYKTQGRVAMAEVYREFLKPNTQSSPSLTTEYSSLLSTYSIPSSYSIAALPTSVSPVPNGNFSSPNIAKEEEYTIKCICGYNDEDGNAVFCERCESWQHIECYYHGKKVPEIHLCTDCTQKDTLTDINVNKARGRQRRARQMHDERYPVMQVDSYYATRRHPIIEKPAAKSQDLSKIALKNENVSAFSVGGLAQPNRDQIEKFSRCIFLDLGLKKLTHEQYGQYLSEPGDVFDKFASRLTHKDSSLDLVKFAEFVYENKREIGHFLESYATRDSDWSESINYDHSENLEDRFSDRAIPTSTKMEMWQQRTSLEPEPQTVDIYYPYGDAQELKVFENVKKIVQESPAYKWLLATLRNKMLLFNADPSIIEQVSASIMTAFSETGEVGSRYPWPIYTATFEIDWPLRLFLDAQWPDWQDTGWIGEIVTLTGDFSDAQAVTANAYMEQTWPLTGPSLLQVLDKAIRDGEVATYNELEQLRLQACENGISLVVKVQGITSVIAEVGEQLCWLASALKPAPKGVHLYYHIPCVSLAKRYDDRNTTEFSRLQSKLRAMRLSRSKSVVSLTVFKIKIRRMQAIPTSEKQGTCWHRLFGTVAVVRGFPILRRGESQLGLEIPLDITAALLGTKYVSHFNDIAYMRGCSAVLSASMGLGDLALWHLNIGQDKGDFSLLDCGMPLHRFEKSATSYKRHIVGWSQQAKQLIGSADCSYDIRTTIANQVRTTDALHDCILSPVNTVPNTQPFHILRDQYPYFHEPEQLPRMMRRLSGRFVCFWDASDRRAWLTDGIGALAHLVRASMRNDEQRTPQFVTLQPHQLEEPCDPYSFSAPADFLCDAKNQNAEILKFPHKGTFKVETFEDRVSQLYHVLDVAFTYCEERRKALKRSTRGVLEGWNFYDLVGRRDDPHRARRFKIGSDGRGWVEMLRDISALTLAGSGFGELMTPVISGVNSVCSAWANLPRDQYYLATSTHFLKQIMLRCYGNIDSHPERLTKALCWIMPKDSFECCGCKKGASGTGHIQMIWPYKNLANIHHLCKIESTHCENSSIVVFGYNHLHRWYWPDRGPPVEGSPPVVVRTEDITDSDSSMDESNATGRTAAWRSQTNTSVETSITTPYISERQLGYSQCSYGDSSVSGSGQQINGNIYNIVTNNSVSAFENNLSSDQNVPRLANFASQPLQYPQGYPQELRSSNEKFCMGEGDRHSPTFKRESVSPEATEEVNQDLSRTTHLRLAQPGSVDVAQEVHRAFASIPQELNFDR